MSSLPEPLRPVYAAGETAAARGRASKAGAIGAPSVKKTSSRSGKKTASRKKPGKSTQAGARRLMEAACEPLRRVVSGSPRSRGQTGSRQQSAPVVSVELQDGSFSTANPRECPAVKRQEHPSATAEDIAAVIEAAANVSGGLAVSSPQETDRLRAAEVMMRGSLQKYQAAMRQMEVRFEVLDRDLSLKKNRNPIHHIESRIKKPASIFEKLRRQELPVTIESMERNLFDIAGVRVICSYIHDVYSLLDLLKKQDDLEIVTVKDYISDPKPNGYRSLHAIVRIPVYFMDAKEMVPVEVQLRTVAMDFWASLEHSLKYKAVREVQGIDASDELKDCSRIIEDVESRMQILARALEEER